MKRKSSEKRAKRAQRAEENRETDVAGESSENKG
jgi:hypothetical protein